jgi:hypothetical protein
MERALTISRRFLRAFSASLSRSFDGFFGRKIMHALLFGYQTRKAAAVLRTRFVCTRQLNCDGATGLPI